MSGAASGVDNTTRRTRTNHDPRVSPEGRESELVLAMG